jgi:hypothetical protein
MRRVSEAWLLNSGFENILGDSLMLMPSLAQTVGRLRMISAEGPEVQNPSQQILNFQLSELLMEYPLKFLP